MIETCDHRRLEPNPLRLASKAEVEAFLEGQFITPTYKDALAREKGLIREWVDKLSQQGPVWFYDMVDPDLEYHAYTTLWRQITLRRCYAPQRTDQYVFHELVHTASFDYASDASLSDRFWDNERTAGQVSNVMVYFEFPDLRGQNPRRNLWADQLLDNSVELEPGVKNQDLYNENRQLFELRLSELRARARNPDDPQGCKRIAMDAAVAVSLAPLYEPIFGEISERVARLMETAHLDPEAACKEHEEWLGSKKQPGNTCPFQSAVSGFNSILPSVKDRVSALFGAE